MAKDTVLKAFVGGNLVKMHGAAIAKLASENKQKGTAMVIVRGKSVGDRPMSVTRHLDSIGSGRYRSGAILPDGTYELWARAINEPENFGLVEVIHPTPKTLLNLIAAITAAAMVALAKSESVAEAA